MKARHIALLLELIRGVPAAYTFAKLKQMPPLSTICSEHRVIGIMECPGEIKKELLK
jgi:hypothetical protein